MPTLHLLGTGAAVSEPHRTTTMLAVADDDHPEPATLLIDCGSDALQRLREAGGRYEDVAGIIVTHAHPDHTSGFPLFMEKLWLSGRERPIPVIGIQSALDQVQRVWEAFAPITVDWDAPDIAFHRVDHVPGATAWDEAPWTVEASPVDHGDMPNVGVRIEHGPSGDAVAYSCDTAPTDAVVDLAHGASLLVHEATGAGHNHSSAEQAAQIAKRAGVERLLLVHLPEASDPGDLAAARQVFPNTDLGTENGTYAFGT
jgi:ribonuclease Z